MQDPPARDVVDIVLASVITLIGGAVSWLWKRVVKVIDNKLDKEIFQQHVDTVSAQLTQIAARHDSDRMEMRDELKSMNGKLDRLVDALIMGGRKP